MKPFILLGSSVVIMMVLLSAVVFINKQTEVPGKHQEIVLRDIGHQLLLHAKDSSSIVLPVKKLNDNTYQISFQNDFGFIPDTLINLVQRQFKKNHLPGDYIVNVKDCAEKEAVFGFEISENSGALTPCLGRIPAVGCYLIEVEFLKAAGFNPALLLLLLIPLFFTAFYMKNKLRKKGLKTPAVDTAAVPAPGSSGNDFLQVGKFRFYPAQSVLSVENEITQLSDKETKALRIFAGNLNQVIEREKLMKEIWEDEGIVVISRNVDVLVSKLRKKLSEDNNIKIINIHGRGYKFMIEQVGAL